MGATTDQSTQDNYVQNLSRGTVLEKGHKVQMCEDTAHNLDVKEGSSVGSTQGRVQNRVDDQLLRNFPLN